MINPTHLPEPVLQRARAMGTTGLEWLDALPATVARLQSEWRLRDSGAFLSGGSASLVLPVSRDDGTPAILKIGLPDRDTLTSEAQVLRLADGRGYVRLLARDDETNALLLERLGQPLAEVGGTIDQQIEALCATLNVAWRVPAEPDGLTTGEAKARWLAKRIACLWSMLGHPCGRATIDQAVTFAAQRAAAFDPGTSVLVHGDAHPWNVLSVIGEEGFRLVDPEGLLAERACDLAVPMRHWSAELLAGNTLGDGLRRCRRLAQFTGVDDEAIWQWGFVERVSTGLHALELGMDEEGRQMLAVADQWTHASP